MPAYESLIAEDGFIGTFYFTGMNPPGEGVDDYQNKDPQSDKVKSIGQNHPSVKEEISTD